MFLRESWYVAAWGVDLAEAGGILAKTIAGEPIVIWRDADGGLHAMEDRCPHRHAPLSRGRVEGNRLRCMYHGMTFNADGRCQSMPLLDTPPNVAVRTYPVVEKYDWLWIWMGDACKADQSLIPAAHGISNPGRPMRHNSIEYEAHYQLVHDNLCDLSHVDFLHATTLQPATGANWSETAPRIQSKDRAVRFERWFEEAQLPGDPTQRVDVWNSYEFAVPGIFIMYGARFPAGTARACNRKEPVGIAPIVENIEQQAVTPISATHTAYHYATGLVGSTDEMTARLAQRMDVIMAAFVEDRDMIEAQQRIWNLTPANKKTLFLPQDKGPFMMRRMMEKFIASE